MNLQLHKKWLITLAIILTLGLLAFLLSPKIPAQPLPENANASQPVKSTNNHLLVSVVDTLVQAQKPMISGFGQATAKWDTQLTSEISGRVDFVSDQLLVGSAFKKGDVLAKINAVDYQSEVDSAKSDVATAQLNFLEQQRETQQAKERWTLSGLSGEPSDLALQMPQLTEAKALLQSTKSALIKAQKDLQRTHISAPFDGRVSARNINPGGYVSSGTVVADIYASATMEINIPLNEQQFALLGNEDKMINQNVTLTDTASSNQQWQARVARFEYHLDSDARTRNLVLQVNASPTQKPLLPGTFVKVNIKGAKINNLIKLPASALARDGYIWYVKDQQLQRFKAQISYRKDDYLVVKSQANMSDVKIVRYPQSAFLPGQSVNAQSVNSPLENNSNTIHASATKTTQQALGGGA